MLVLARKVGQTITLDVEASKWDHKVVIKVIEVRGSTARIGVKAGPDVKVEVGRQEKLAHESDDKES